MESFKYGSVGGAPGNRCFYPEAASQTAWQSSVRPVVHWRALLAAYRQVMPTIIF